MHIAFKHINKRFGATHANADISFEVPPGAVLGLLGENGAGKSTLMKILSGFITPDGGQILLDGKPVRIDSPAAATAHGIGMLHQDPLDFPAMRIIDNFMIGQPGGLLPDRRAAGAALEALQAQFGFSLNPGAYVDTLTVGERQQLELVRLLALGAQVLILDEPTTGISAPQKVKLFAALKKLAAEGRTILFVSHKLPEVHDLCTHVAVLRRGRLVGEAQAPFESERLVQLMFEREVVTPPRRASHYAEETLHLEGITAEVGRLKLGPLDLTVKAGEVLGLAGMEGSGQDAFLRLCAGLLRPTGGQISVKGMPLGGRPYHDFMAAGVKYLPANRMEEGLIPGLTLAEHFALTAENPGFFIQAGQVEAVTQERIAAFNVKGTPASPVESLSGGNQQRAMTAMLHLPVPLLLVEHPTRGLDIESAAWLWGQLKSHAQQSGMAVIFVSSDLEEILQYSDRVLVFFGGQVTGPLPAEAATIDQLGQLIGGLPAAPVEP